MLIIIDCGSTNMRARLFKDRTCLDETHRKAGVRNTAFDGTNAFLRQSLRECVEELLTRNHLTPGDVEAILSSGTLSSDVGIYHVPHVPAPTGVRETAAHAKMVTLPEITPIPILFIPGVKTVPEDGADEMSRIAGMDSMSGEDCETYGIIDLLPIREAFQIALPGSYLKVLDVNEEGQITTFTTGMCGEFLAAISEHTLVKASLPHPLITEIDEKYLCMGYDFCHTWGSSPSLIKGRMMPVWGQYPPQQTANFFVGAALHDDVGLILSAAKKDRPMYIGGSNPLRSVFGILCRHAGISCREMIEIPDEIAKFAPNIGAMKVYQTFKKG